ncbi:Putative acyl-CoA-binding protein [Monoraphidium neglectum]|uniref:Putative acyl-CoA-binding protein n=1 Tax=Monoraphidium neglectum TaxID=145388 RepID=A0A0D2LDF9_9CHLO|nr:Putative acyl-CoA-binding protein [Monoraphidium neglectum]KIZ04729.1 Putative acyl-CoA-binding protein [Monoraphidium neglectum]|eukprot:XP_013903748.1 Putative acyl-CoA-binding protein [Monoraphidium neglectum]
MGLEEDFQAAAAEIKPVHGVSWEEMLEMYGLYKQATIGDNNTSKPGILDPKGRKKWDAWESKKGLSKEEAMTKYIE